MENVQYLKYKKQFKLNCILKVISSAIALVAIIFLLFIPSFQIRLEEIVIFEFSVFDEIKHSVTSATEANASWSMFGILQIMATVYIAVGAVFAVVDLVKSLMKVTGIESYALSEYDNIKTRANSGGKKSFNRFSVTNFFISGVVLEIMCIIMQKMFSKYLGSSVETSYFAQVNGISWRIVFFVLVLAAFIGVIIAKSVLYNKVKMSILKEDYGMDK